ncbi:hypothetical protein INT47_009512 [Mucor saturninus]|uniref:Uncharacterized protein n=1 Tax=Mucor saturninus TaxID=64648 RepID=A0A8H7R6B9_9FUNG|nr:hypothetical protein INT47_009512 [Mucor saturninus]
MDTRFDTGLGTGMVALAFNTAFGTGVYHSRGFCTGVDACAVLAPTRVFGTDMNTRFDTDLVGTGKVALAFQNCFRHWRLPLEGLLHWRRYLCCTRSNTDEGPMEGAVAFNTRLGTYRHSLQHRFRHLAWHWLALARNWLSILLSVLAFANGWWDAKGHRKKVYMATVGVMT